MQKNKNFIIKVVLFSRYNMPESMQSQQYYPYAYSMPAKGRTQFELPPVVASCNYAVRLQ